MKWKENTGLIKNAALCLAVLCIFLYLFQVFLGNPLEGTWKNEEMEIQLEIKKDGEAILSWSDHHEIALSYEIGKQEKEITFIRNSETMNYLRNGEASEEQEEEINLLIDAFLYSVEGQKLILQECDFGEQILFTKVK